jgi:hypothetical protein
MPLSDADPSKLQHDGYVQAAPSFTVDEINSTTHHLQVARRLPAYQQFSLNPQVYICTGESGFQHLLDPTPSGRVSLLPQMALCCLRSDTSTQTKIELDVRAREIRQTWISLETEASNQSEHRKFLKRRCPRDTVVVVQTCEVRIRVLQRSPWPGILRMIIGEIVKRR